MRKPFNVIIVSPFASPEKGANVERVSHLQSFFSSQNMNTITWSPQRSTPSAEKVWRYPSLRALASRIWNDPPSLVIGTSPPMTHAAVAALACLFRGVPFILDIRDPWPDAAQKIGLYSKWEVKYWVYKILEHVTYRIARQAWVVNPYLKEWLGTRLNSKKIHVISNGTLPLRFKPSPSARKKMRTRFSISPITLTILFSGDFSSHGLESFLAKTLPVFKKKNVMIVLATTFSSSKNESYWKEIFSEHAFTSFRLIDLPALSDKEVSDLFAMADWGVSLVPSSLPYMIPVKTYDYIAAGLFVFARAPKGGALDSFMMSEKIGKIVHADEYAPAALDSLFSHPSEWKKTAKLNQGMAPALSRDIQAQKAVNLIRELKKKISIID